MIVVYLCFYKAVIGEDKLSFSMWEVFRGSSSYMRAYVGRVRAACVKLRKSFESRQRAEGNQEMRATLASWHLLNSTSVTPRYFETGFYCNCQSKLSIFCFSRISQAAKHKYTSSTVYRTIPSAGEDLSGHRIQKRLRMPHATSFMHLYLNKSSKFAWLVLRLFATSFKWFSGFTAAPLFPPL